MEASEAEIKDKFKERYSKLTDWDPFITCSLSFLRRSIRVNTLKISVADLKKKIDPDWKLTPIPWCKEGFWIENEERRDVGNLREHALGYIYVQEAVSMIPPIVLDPKPGELVLDMCAAPGSKTSQIAMYMKNKGILVANDISHMRMAPLGINLQRCGVTNCIITKMYGQWFKELQFDKVLVDAPCSGTGTIRKSLKTLKIWNPSMVERISYQQKKLLETGFGVLKPGGTLVYSTCSLEPFEDEGVVDSLLKKHDAKLEDIEIKLKRGKPIMEFEGEKYSDTVKKCLRIWPQDNNTEGFFVSKIKKLSS